MKDPKINIDSGAGKGSEPRPVDRKKWDDAAYWKELAKKKAVKKKKK